MLVVPVNSSGAKLLLVNPSGAKMLLVNSSEAKMLLVNSSGAENGAAPIQGWTLGGMDARARQSISA